MRNMDLIRSVAQDIVDNHYDKDESEEFEEDDSFHTMFEVTNESMWDHSVPPRKVVNQNIALFVLTTSLAILAFPIILTQPIPVGIITLVILLTAGAGYYTNRLKLYSRNLAMLSLHGISLIISLTALATYSITLLSRMFNV